MNWIDEDPLFVDAVDADYRLQENSPAVDAGDDGLINQGFDLARNYRIMGDAVDIGCYEYRIPTVMYVDADATGMNTGMDWENAFETLTDALAFTRTNDELWVAEGTYLPGPFDEDGFNIYEEIRVFGGFDGTETHNSSPGIIKLTGCHDIDVAVLVIIPTGNRLCSVCGGKEYNRSVERATVSRHSTTS